jgi:hypothetical protein
VVIGRRSFLGFFSGAISAMVASLKSRREPVETGFAGAGEPRILLLESETRRSAWLKSASLRSRMNPMKGIHGMVWDEVRNYLFDHLCGEEGRENWRAFLLSLDCPYVENPLEEVACGEATIVRSVWAGPFPVREDGLDVVDARNWACHRHPAGALVDHVREADKSLQRGDDAIPCLRRGLESVRGAVASVRVIMSDFLEEGGLRSDPSLRSLLVQRRLVCGPLRGKTVDCVSGVDVWVGFEIMSARDTRG